MTKETLFSLLLFAPGILAAQQQKVFSSAGLDCSDRKQQITATLGEPFITVTTENPHMITEGFQQGSPLVIPPGIVLDRENQPNDWNAMLFPNPATDWVQVSFQSKKQQTYRLRLINALGVVVLETETANELYQLDLRDFSTGQYWLSVQSTDLMESTWLPLSKVQL
ncbi:MAG TPA: hypothetical protein DCF33_05875 [Saprospirales bacterium]|nr:hypothetical protein [Saprospirales bacterium]